MIKCSDCSDKFLLIFGASATFRCFCANFWHVTIMVMPILVLNLMLICWCWCWFWCWHCWCWWCWCWCWSPDGQVTECSLGREVHFANTRMPLVTHILSQRHSIKTKRTRHRYCPSWLPYSADSCDLDLSVPWQIPVRNMKEHSREIC